MICIDAAVMMRLRVIMIDTHDQYHRIFDNQGDIRPLACVHHQVFQALHCKI